MKILHTSDWHLGQNFMGKSREEEHHAFLAWLRETIETESVDVLIVAGDIFDTGTPPNYALELYYNFLKELASSHSCKNIIITAGNHDSIATLKAPKQLLKALNVHVITSGDENEDELIPIYDKEDLQGIVCAVPFLRDHVVRKAQSGQTMQDKELSLNEGIKEHYNDVFEQAKRLRRDLKVPIIATGHLTTVGSRSSESERDIYIGGTIDIGGDFLGKDFDYVALGHLHINQTVGSDHVRYSGSPIPLSFSESKTQKKINIVTFTDNVLNVKEVNIPLHRPLLLLKGDVASITKELNMIIDKSTWVEVHLSDSNPFASNQAIRELAEELDLTLLAVKIDKLEQALYAEDFDVLSLDELTPLEVFNRRLEVDAFDEEDLKEDLIKNFKIIVDEVETL
ncbi:nuclease SbcCD subunit D [Sulfurovum sp. TSL6]|uniref:exonuclease SbcCD subunit D C-terminal domain-containing protein n=1 Tax=Sulfurovum sp. TSL6 TaxID=2826995 RepID=UPI001CC5CF69|nr:exonuclease SbcCD subunit D C-terminal domain-containing protein [Sulfurovum sp. TSL6]GIT99715.1 nuclease SbcCD subunit D [Sulfurovum sp. TSL6]